MSKENLNVKNLRKELKSLSDEQLAYGNVLKLLIDNQAQFKTVIDNQGSVISQLTSLVSEIIQDGSEQTKRNIQKRIEEAAHKSPAESGEGASPSDGSGIGEQGLPSGSEPGVPSGSNLDNGSREDSSNQSGNQAGDAFPLS